MINQVKYLGQSGFKFVIDKLVIYLDPYLSNSLENNFGNYFKRNIKIPINPSSINDADFIFITHIHQDHCDLESLIPIYQNSQNSFFVGPKEVCDFLSCNGFNTNRLIIANTDCINLSNLIKVIPIPAAHPSIDIDDQDYYKSLGYLFDINGFKIYHSGDTFIQQDIIDILLRYAPMNIVILPINEHNFMREKLGIIGNMSLREAFYLADFLNAKELIPIHWDMFELNSVYKEEIQLLYKLLKPNFTLNLIEMNNNVN